MAKNSSDEFALARLQWAATRFLSLFAISVFLLVSCSSVASAQRRQAQAELSSEIRVEEPEQKITQFVERAKAAVADQQWDEVLDLYASVIEQAGDQIVRLDATRFITVREFCQRQIAAAPDTLRKRYRTRYNAHAQKLYDESIATHNRAKLQSVVDDFFLTSVGDDALLALGELSLEEGDASFSRQCWGRLLTSADASILKYPDSNLAPVEIRARIVLATLAERNHSQLKTAIEQFKKDFPTQTGRLGAKSGIWYELLQSQIDSDAAAEKIAASEKEKNHVIASSESRSSTFAANSARKNHYPLAPDAKLSKPAWPNTITISGRWQFDPRFAQMMGIASQSQKPSEQHIAIHPLISQGKVFFSDEERIYAYDLQTGKPAWPSEQRAPGEIYLSNLPSAKQPEYDPEQMLGRFDQQQGTKPVKFEPGTKRYYTLGALPQFTLTVQGNFLLARIGSPITVPSRNFNTSQPNQIVCLNLNRQGLEQWSVKPPDERWSFEGTPLADEDHVYVLLRSNDIRPQVHIVCYDLQTGMQQWRRMIAGGETASKGTLDEITCLLPTLAEGKLFVATNLGAVAAIDAMSGRIVWITQYKRAARFDNATHWSRDLNPPVYYRGMIYVAPQDSPTILAIDAASGTICWSNETSSDVVHLLGPTHDGKSLIASGREFLHWLNLETGKPDREKFTTENAKSNPATGRGILANEMIYWPREKEIVVVPQSGHGETGKIRLGLRTIPLEKLSKGLTGGNLVADENLLLITTSKEIMAIQ